MLGRNSQEFIDASIMKAEIETTGYKGGGSKKRRIYRSRTEGYISYKLGHNSGTRL